ncbi:MAG: hypothetical protein K2M84_01770 [Anaeroplasmataceae bacterium]|nr:hypothetical protein [Anaeroplasmataceae bacterium]
MSYTSLIKLNRICNIILSCITFLLTILILAQFIYVHQLYYFIIAFLIHLGLVFTYHSLIQHIYKKRGYVLHKKNDEFKIIWLVIFILRILSCCIILSMIHLGNLFEVEEVALAGDPFSITYMVFVFLLLFLEFFSIFVSFVEKSEEKD